ncbi:AMP-binding protein [Saccharothrix sp. ST-888]|uniref:AMP-binding protein n=1 Tax=Saccharothrix sp. ST-888 TaxID=1427391 RepID=UPI0005ED2BFD|nr:AMP-binding protein [Saccharothrix sp. ST-888]
MTSTTLLHEWFRTGLRRNPDGPALAVAGEQIAYRTLDLRARAWAAALLAAPAGAPTRVGILAAKSPEAYTGLLATLYAGAAAVPLGPENPVARNLAVAEAAGVDALIVDPAGAAQVRPLAELLPLRTVLAPRGPGGAIPDGLAEEYREPTGRSVADLAYILFTSGSTGSPKGVPISHGNVGAFLRAALPRYSFGPADRFSQIYELTFDLAMFDLFMAWASGACVHSLSRLQALDPARCVRAHGLTVWHTTPSLARALQSRGLLGADSMPGLRHTVFCGEPLPEDTALAWHRAAPRSTVDNIYGPTELTIACTAHRWEPPGPVGSAVGPDGDAASRTAGGGTVPIGVPNEGMEYFLLSSPSSADAFVGELCMTGPQMFGGYLDPANDRGRFVTHAGRRWYRTGDRVRLDDTVGLIHLGRNDTQVKVNGYRVEPSEVAAQIRALTGSDAVAFAAATPDGTVLAAYVLGGPAPDLVALARRLAERLPAYMLPGHLWWLPVAPLNGNGKTDLALLKAEAVDRIAELAGGGPDLAE